MKTVFKWKTIFKFESVARTYAKNSYFSQQLILLKSKTTNTFLIKSAIYKNCY